MDNLEPITRNEMFLNGDDLEPITREEMILAGEDLEPITRHEWFLKRYRGGGGGGGYDLVNVPNLPADIASFNDGTDLPMASLKVTVTPYQDLSHGDPSPENICPIIGWDEAVVSVSGINIWDEEWEVGGISDSTGQNETDSTIRSKNYIDVIPSIIYHIQTPQNGIYQIFLYDAQKSYMYAVLMSNIINGNYQIPSGCHYLRFRCLTTYGTTYNNDISINYPSTDTSYHAYNGATYTIDLDGTRYGGTLDVTNGTMTVDRVMMMLDGSRDEGWTIIVSGTHFRGFTYALSGIKPHSSDAQPTSAICDKIKTGTWNEVFTGVPVLGQTDKAVGFGLDSFGITDIVDLEGWLSNNPITIVYELATPITVQLAPTPVKSLEGVNKIYANCGQITEGKYFKRA